MFPKFYKNFGFVRSVADGIVTIVGLDLVRYGEMVLFTNREIGVVLNLQRISISAIVLGSGNKILPGDFVFRTAKLMGVYASGALLGSIVNPLGKRLSKSKNTFNRFYGKYMQFKDLFSIFFLDSSSFKELLMYDGDVGHFYLNNNSLIKESYMLGFMADYVKLLSIKETFSVFKDLRDFFDLYARSYVKGFYRQKKLFSSFIDSKVDSLNFNR
jgi:hypothetical protein